MKNIFLFLVFSLLSFLGFGQRTILVLGDSLRLDTNNVSFYPNARFDLFGDTNWCDVPFVLRITDHTIGGKDSLIVDAGGVGSVLHIWLSNDTLDFDFKYRLEIQEVYLTELSTAATAKKGAWLLVNSTSGAISIAPPPSAVEGDWFGVLDSRGTSLVNNITITFSSNGYKLNGATADGVISTNTGAVKYVYRAGTLGFVIVQ